MEKDKGIRIDRKTLALADHACKDYGRYAIDSLIVESDGTAAVSDGRMLAILAPPVPDPWDDKPDAFAMARAPVCIPRDVAKNATRGIPKKGETCHIVSGESGPELEMRSGRRIRREQIPANTQPPFGWRGMVAKQPDGGATIHVSPERLAKLAKLAADLSGPNGHAVELRIPEDNTKALQIRGRAAASDRPFLILLAPVNVTHYGEESERLDKANTEWETKIRAEATRRGEL